MEKGDLALLAQRYLGFMPQDRNCKDWSEMQEQMAGEIMDLAAASDTKCEFNTPPPPDSSDPDVQLCPRWKIYPGGCGDCRLQTIF